MQVDFLSYLDYFISSGITELENRLTTQFGLKSLPNRSPDEILEGILACSPKDLEKKRKGENYYVCNTLCLLEVVKKIFDRALYTVLSAPNIPSIMLHNYCHILKWILMDSEELCNQYANFVLGDTQYAGLTHEQKVGQQQKRNHHKSNGDAFWQDSSSLENFLGSEN